MKIVNMRKNLKTNWSRCQLVREANLDAKPMKGRRRQICNIVIFNIFVHEVATVFLVFKIGIAQTSVTNVKLPGWTVQCLALGWGHCPGSSRFPSRTHLPPRGWGGARGARWVFVRFKHFIWHFVILTFDHVQKQKSS